MKNSSTRERRDWTLLIFLIPIGIILMLIAGLIAIRLPLFWSITADMRSKLDPNSAPKREMGLLPPIGAGILTPYDVNLTPDSAGGVILFPPIVIFEPNGTPPISISQVPTAPPATQTAPPLPTKVNTAIPTVTKNLTPLYTQIYPTLTKRPTNVPTNVPTNTLVVIPTIIPTNTPTATPLFTSTNTPTETAISSPTVVPIGYPSTIDPGLILVPPDIIVGSPDGTITSIPRGSFTVINITSSPVIIVGSSETGWDLIYYEAEFNGPGQSGIIFLDNVILGISTFADGHIYYDVFNWGNGAQDLNTNIWNVADVDNQQIPLTDLWNYPVPPSTGIAINADGAPSQPPPDTYNYLVVICPLTGADGMEVDSIQIFP